MAILNYKDLNLTKTNTVKTFQWGDKTVEVLKYLPIESEYDIVMITLQRAYEDGIYNPIKLDMYYHLNLVYSFTNLIFSDEDRENETELYDALNSSGFMDLFLSNIDENIYAEMQSYIEAISNLKMSYGSSAAAVLKKFVDDLPANAEAMKQIVENFNPEQYQAVLDFAKAANGGRPIS